MSTTTHVYTDEHLSLLRAIREQPDDDTVRLAFADYLDGMDTVSVGCQICKGKGTLLAGGRGNGDRYTPVYEVDCSWCSHGFVADTSNRDRAELIRVQVELGNLDCTTPNCERHADQKGCSCDECRRFYTNLDVDLPLRKRERELLAANAERWRKGPVCEKCGGVGKRIPTSYAEHVSKQCPDCCGTGDAGGLLREFNHLDELGFTTRNLPTVEYHRGMKRVHCTAADVWKRVVGDRDELGDKDLKWEPTPWALAVCRHHPDVVELFTEREPYHVGHSKRNPWVFRFGNDFMDSEDGHVLPFFLREFVRGTEHIDTILEYPSEERGREELGTSFVRWVHTFLKDR